MKEYQKETIETYENNLGLYISGTPEISVGGFKEFIDVYISTLPDDAQVLEIGSGTGRDANYIESHTNIQIIRTDVVQSFIEYQKTHFGADVQYLDALLLDDIELYDGIIAFAVLLHFSREDCVSVCKKIYRALKPGGSFAFRMKNKLTDIDEEVSTHKMNSPRYFRYWEYDDFVSELENIGFTCDNVIKAEKDKWIQGIAWKH